MPDVAFIVSFSVDEWARLTIIQRIGVLKYYNDHNASGGVRLNPNSYSYVKINTFMILIVITKTDENVL